MTQRRSSRLAAACIALFSILFMQLAVAAYACPNLIPAPPAAMLDSAGEVMANSMADCQEMDPHSPALCDAHTHKLASSLDKPDAPAVPAFVAAGFALALLWPEKAAPLPHPPPVFLHACGTSPPIALRHCRFHL
jgi:hypothetical protein